MSPLPANLVLPLNFAVARATFAHVTTCRDNLWASQSSGTGGSLTATADVPEPATIVLAALGMFAFVIGRRHRRVTAAR